MIWADWRPAASQQWAKLAGGTSLSQQPIGRLRASSATWLRKWTAEQGAGGHVAVVAGSGGRGRKWGRRTGGSPKRDGLEDRWVLPLDVTSSPSSTKLQLPSRRVRLTRPPASK